MTPSQTCRVCGEARAIDAFKRLRSGNRAAVCTPCNRAAADDAREADLQARLEARRRFGSARKANATTTIALTTEQEAVQHAQRETQEQRREREASVRDVVWDAMRTGRYRRAAMAIRPDPSPVHRIKLANGAGFISIAELACRCVEREATSRAAASCKTYEAAYSAARILERATATLDRKGEVDQLWRDDQPQNTFRPLGCPSDDPEIDEDNLFEDAFGDWAPSWAATAASSWPASRAG
jgi:hypothetical protein